jgi:ubiquitin carboxyl-terminal hydrolase 8
MINPIGTKGKLANAFAGILHDMWKQEHTYLVPTTFRVGHVNDYTEHVLTIL